MAKEAFHPGAFYHVYNRGNNRENLFREPANYDYFLRLYRQYLYPAVATYAYCLLPNHFHFLIRVREEVSDVEGGDFDVSKQLATCCGTYVKAINNRYGRSGRLFEDRIRRKHVPAERYFMTLVVYIHRNPQTHGLIGDFREWKHGSYPGLLSARPTRLERDAVLAWFGGRQLFVEAHARPGDVGEIEGLLIERCAG